MTRLKFDAEAAERGRAAKTEVERRVLAAIDRLDVMLQFGRDNGAVVAQALHAVHHLERGYADSRSQDNIPDEAPDFRISPALAEELALALANMLGHARGEKWTRWGDRS